MDLYGNMHCDTYRGDESLLFESIRGFCLVVNSFFFGLKIVLRWKILLYEKGERCIPVVRSKI